MCVSNDTRAEVDPFLCMNKIKVSSKLTQRYRFGNNSAIEKMCFRTSRLVWLSLFKDWVIPSRA